MIAKEITFINPVPVLGTYVRESYFSAAAGWIIDVHDYGVTLSKPESQNVAEVPAFCICGVGYSVPQAAPATHDRGVVPEVVVDADAVVSAVEDGKTAAQVAASIAAGIPAGEVVRGLSYAELAARPAKGKR